MKQSVNSIINFVKNHKYGKPVLVLLVILIGVSLSLIVQINQPEETVPLSDVASAIINGNVVKVEDTEAQGRLRLVYADGTEGTAWRDPNSPFLEQMHYLGVNDSQLAELEYQVSTEGLLSGERGISLFMTLGFLGVVGFAMLRLTGVGSITSRKNYREGIVPGINFGDVAGLESSCEELRDVVMYLEDNSRYQHIGAKMPRGILLVGDPGTGKTLLAKAVAGEAGVPFFSTSGSEFVEVFVGVGANRVRSLFKNARAKAPCIVFIDEIDAMGRKRHISGGGGEMEQDQTLNQLLVEMDGFSASDGVVVLAATNRSDVLDPALTRPGRFDRRVDVVRPDVKGRQSILEIHVKGKRLSPDVNLQDIAKSTPGLVGADLANIVNEAAILAVRAGRDAITMQDFQSAVEKALTGSVEQKGRVMGEEERQIIAYHEAGHAVVMNALPHSDPVYKVTIIPRGPTGGFTMSLPEKEGVLISRNQILARITGLMGGRVAEEMFCGDITSGAANDLQIATQLAEEMVMRLGMSASGLRVFSRSEGFEALSSPKTGQKTFEAIDATINRILEDCYKEAKRIVTSQREVVERVTKNLLEKETLTREEFKSLV